MRRFPAFRLWLPDWIDAALPAADHVYATPEERMALAIRLAELNVSNGTGGPFAAAVFDLEAYTLVAPGVNAVVRSKASIAHAEIVAISTAQRVVDNHDLGASGLPPMELVTTCEPCAMCLGALPWSGIGSVLCAARDEDARAAGFDEGAKPRDWPGALKARGIEVRRDLDREKALSVLESYIASGGPVYNGRSGGRGDKPPR